MHWKIARDELYAPLYQKLGLEGILEAGFFFDKTSVDAPLDDVGWLSTPLSKLQRSSEKEKKVVLLSTGAFSPIHKGHIHMMECAKKSLLERGEKVIGGYLSLGHDVYLQQKLGASAMPAAHRMWLCSLALHESSWLMVDPWEAFARSTYVNLSDVYCRLLQYLRFHLREDIELVYVCGGDNAHLALAFAFFGRCVVIGRPGFEAHMERYKNHPLLVGNHHILWERGNEKASSTRVRLGKEKDLPEGFSLETLSSLHATKLSLRWEDERVVEAFDVSLECWQRFQEEVHACFQHYLRQPVSLHGENKGKKHHKPTISLDVWSDASHTLGISRAFDLGGQTFLGYVPRPGSPTIEEQIARIPSGEYLLEDDDCMTGNTLRYARGLFPEHIVITKEEVCKRPTEDEEILDIRDFLFGGRHSGLVVLTPLQSYVRLPYILPYVDPYRRCRLPPEHVVRFSLAIWQCNHRFFSSSPAIIASLSLELQELVLTIGFQRDTKILAVIEWHIERLKLILGESDAL